MTENSYDPVSSPYGVDERDFPRAGGPEEQFVFLLRYAVLAPSTHNTQPWKFGLTPEGIEVFADYTRRMRAVDPFNRELLMSLGAAVTNLRVAAAHFGFFCRVSYNLSGDSERPVAIVRPSPSDTDEPADARHAALFPWITRRHTNRAPFLVSRVPRAVLDMLASLQEGSRATLLTSTDGSLNERVGDLVAEADRRQLTDPALRGDLAEWISPADGPRTDGIPATALGLHGAAAALGQWTTRTLDLSTVHAARDRNLCINAPGLVTIACEDAVPHWLDAGELLERVLLSLAREGLSVSYFNMPIQVAEIRLQLRALLGCSSWPQLLLRVGYSLTEPIVTPRRRLSDVIVRASTD